ncbi:MAG TPA: GAF domain-containing protein [Thermoleophilaceae bacterium]
MIVESWQRVLATGLEPIDVLPSIEADPSETRERWLEHPLGLLSHVLVEPLQLLAEESNSVVQVTDPSGLTLYLGGPEWLKARAAEMNLVEGARCSETVNGTNGVGTALATGHPVQVFAFEHFSHHHREWVCSGAPIHDRVSGRLVGVLDLSSPWRVAHPRSLELVTNAARAAEQCLLEGRRDHDARLRRRYGDLARKTGDLLVNREGYPLTGDDLAHATPLDIPENGGEIDMGDGSLAVAEPLGRGEAYLVRALGPRRARAARGEALERAEERAGEVESGMPGSRAGERLSAYLDAAIDCVIMADESGRIVEFNPAAERTFGYSRKEALGRTMAELIVPPSLRERHSTAFDRFVKIREGSMLGRRVELTGMRADGSEFPVELALSQVETEPVLICGAMRDISAAKQAESRLREMAEEQAALRQVATLVAHESSPERLLAIVVEQVARVFDVPLARLIRYEPTAALVVGAFSESDDEPFPIGSRWQLDTPGLLATIRHTGRAARVEDYAQAPGDGADAVRAAGMRSAVGSPIVVGGRVWGAIVLLSPQSASLPEDTGARLADFTDLVGTALANAESRAALTQLADEQAALRRVATLVAREASPVDLLATVTEEVARVLGVEAVGLLRFETDGTATLVAQSDTPWDPPPLGTSFTLQGENVVTTTFRTGEAARLDDWSTATGPVAEMAQVLGIRSSVATPIVVEGRVWGTLIAVTSQSDPLPRETDSRIAKFTELVATAIANTESRAALAASEARARNLAGEQAALRRVATLVAEGASSDELFAAVAREAAAVLNVPVVALQRYESDRTFTMVAIVGETKFKVGSRWPVEDEGLAGMILATGRPARREDYTTMPGPLGAALRDGGLVSVVGVPIVVDGSIWGFMTAGGRPGRPTPDGTEGRLARFTELVATAIADSQAREQVAQLAFEQAALRRVATMVARAPESEQLFSTVAREVASVLDVPGVIVTRYEPDGTAVTVGEAFGPDLAGAERFLGIGTPMPPDPGTLTALVLETQDPARVDDLSTSPGTVGEVARAAELGSGCAGPIVVNGAVWGKMCVFSRVGTVLPAGTEDRLHDFVELIATAIANYEARGELAASEARARELADEQAALRRVATLVARGVSPEEIFSAVTNEMGRLFDSPQAYVGRFEPDGSAMVVVGVSDGIRGISLGSRWELEDYMASTRVFRTGRPVRVVWDDFEHISGPMADVLRKIGAVSSVGAPIVVEGQQWGFVTVTDTNKRLPVNAEMRLEKFAELLATAIANAQSRAELAASEARARGLAAEQAALRRVATLVAKGAKGDAVFSAVAHEVAHVFGVQHVTVCRYEPDAILVLSAFEDPEPTGAPPPFPAGRRLPLDDSSLPGSIHRTGKPARIDDFTGSHDLAAVARQAGFTAAVGVPIVVDGTVWGAINIASTNNESLLPDAEDRLARFTDLVATSVSNATMREELAGSRARIIAAGDDARRRIERDLHDGAQQRLITLTLALRRANAKLPEGADELHADLTRVAEGMTTAVDELRELSRGIHPSILTEGGLSPALKALGRRSPVRVKLDIGFEQRLSDHVEVAAYYTVSEALTNASKHANATRVWVSLRIDHDMLRLSIRDDGVGGADPNRGSGLTGLRDRIEALGGRIKIESPSGNGTLIEVEIPIGEPADRDHEPGELLSQVMTPGSPS